MTDNRIAKLRHLYKKNATAKKVLDWFAMRLNNSGETSLDRCAQVVGVDRTELIEVFKALEVCGVGKFIIGRRGANTRFEWSVGLVSAGQVAHGGPAEKLISWPVAEPEENDKENMTTTLMQRGRELRAHGVTITLSRSQVSEIMDALTHAQ
jgi:hypothetical protein